MNYLITTSDINSLGAFNATFMDLLNARLTIHSTGEEQGWQKTNDLTHQFILLHNSKQINKRLVFWCSHITFAWIIK